MKNFGSGVFSGVRQAQAKPCLRHGRCNREVKGFVCKRALTPTGLTYKISCRNSSMDNFGGRLLPFCCCPSLQNLSSLIEHRSDARQDEFNLKLLYCEFQKYEVMTVSVVGSQPKKHANPSYKATKHIELLF